MYTENSMIKNAAAELQVAFTAAEPDEARTKEAFEKFGAAIAASVAAEYDSARGDQNILLQRGFRVLTAPEQKFYEDVIEAGKQRSVQTMNGLLSDKVMPNTIIEDVYRDLVQEHPLLSAINFQSVEYLTRWILNDHSVQTAVWGEINSAITEEITSAFRVIEVTQCKLSAYAVIEKDMLDLGPQFLDNYIRTFLKEALAVGLENGIVSGTGANQPIGLDRDVHQGVSVTSGAYPQKNAESITDFTPATYGAILAKLAVTEVWYTNDSTGAVTPAATAAETDGSAKTGYTKHGGNMRSFDEVTLLCNQVDYLSKIMPATTVLNNAGAYINNLFPFPTNVIRCNGVPTGKAILFLPNEYFMGLGSSKEGVLEYSDDFKFLEDKRTFKIKMHGMGTPIDDTCAVLLDISELDPAYLNVKVNGSVTTVASA